MDSDLNRSNITAPLPFTGERMVPEGAGLDTIWEHLYRYRFACSYVSGKDVLDVACGEGYGTAALAAAGARMVIGVDVDKTACEHARRRYEQYGIDVRQGDATQLPVTTATVDVIVSFETIEHIPKPAAFLAECRRVLRPCGMLVISTPNIAVYSPDPTQKHNEFHCSEMTEAEFHKLLSVHFDLVGSYVQRPTAGPRWHPRSLARIPRVWLGHRGIGRIQAWLMRWSEIEDPEAESRARLEPLLVIQSTESRLGRLTNPYVVRSRARGIDEMPMYLVAVCRLRAGA